MDGTLRADDRRGKEVRRVEHPGAGRLERGDLEQAVQQLKRQPGKGRFVGGVKLPMLVSRLELGSGAVAMRYEPKR